MCKTTNFVEGERAGCNLTGYATVSWHVGLGIVHCPTKKLEY